MRVTFDAMHRDATAGLERASARMLDHQRQVSTGKRVETPSDDPAAAATSIVERARIATTEHYTRAADSVA
jgi:flagellar hook-associated protein 3 FlgL